MSVTAISTPNRQIDAPNSGEEATEQDGVSDLDLVHELLKYLVVYDNRPFLRSKTEAKKRLQRVVRDNVIDHKVVADPRERERKSIRVVKLAISWSYVRFEPHLESKRRFAMQVTADGEQMLKDCCMPLHPSNHSPESETGTAA